MCLFIIIAPEAEWYCQSIESGAFRLNEFQFCGPENRAWSGVLFVRFEQSICLLRPKKNIQFLMAKKEKVCYYLFEYPTRNLALAFTCPSERANPLSISLDLN